MTEFTTSQTTQQLALNNELFVKQLDAALMNAHLPPNILREMILDVNKSLECDQDCQERKLIDKLKTDWTNSKNIAIKSEDNREQARAKYFHATKGVDYYEANILTPEFQNEINKRVNNYKQELAKLKVTNSATLDAYSASYIALTRIKELYDITLKENKDLKQKLDDKRKFVNTGERRVWYEFQSIDRQEFYSKIITIVYYVIIGIFAIIQLVYKNALKSLGFWAKLVGLIILPYFILWGVKLIYKLLFYFKMVS
ncbi:hypothetical protein ceV_270 [Chrysochromulina ericina virus CeV-01B]|jgi:hypothetical protein|uniref:Uncharacterized protein n=1 Tax=Chrysochromulina ericina virus CeV-01B TaxID=3070830 RepID=A0A0N9QAK7_9VIRU|nr:hypothetical protein ceV_270 [Chrysochromulina ericina virus]ALH23176.1 hypothetical protein ceV_270 [Chrysochromulina ericina virus CeV-01B]